VSRRRQKQNKAPVNPRRSGVDEWVDLMKEQLARIPESQQEEIRAALRAVMRGGGWSPKAADQVMARIPPDPNAPRDEEALFLTYPWMARLSDAQRNRCLSDIAGAVGNDPPDRIEPGVLARVFTYWRDRAER